MTTTPTENSSSNINDLLAWSDSNKSIIGSRLKDVKTYNGYNEDYYTIHIDRAFQELDKVKLTDFIQPKIDNAKTLRMKRGRGNVQASLEILYPIIAALGDKNNDQDKWKIIDKYGIVFYSQ